MPTPESELATRYLQELEAGDESAVERLLPHVYDDLRRVAEGMFRKQWRQHTLQPTALVHEAYLRLVRPENAGWESRRHFVKVATLAMRQLLTDYARGHDAAKRGAQKRRVVLEEALDQAEEGGVSEIDLVAMHEALTDLRALDARQAEIVELRFLSGLTIEETADVLGVSVRTVSLDWKMARSWLERRLGEG